MNNRPIFIGGLMKSGTTLLRTMLSNHSNIFSGLETHWFEKIYVNPSDREYLNKMAVFFDVSIEIVENIAQNSKTENTLFINDFFEFLTKNSNKTRWVEKTPQNINNIEKIRTHFHDFIFIHVLRDFRDVYTSWKQSNKYDINYFIDEVKKTYQLFLSQQKTIESKLYQIKYEDLVQNPKQEMSNLLSFLGEKIEFECFNNNSEKSKIEFQKVNKLYKKESVTLTSLQEEINIKKIGFYKKLLDPKEILLLEKELGGILKLMGYEK